MQVFASHSKDDEEGRAYFDRLFASSGGNSIYWYAWEGPEPPHAQTLRKAIGESASVAVILSPKMDNPYTRAWVGYEVGLAHGLGKNVWVFERSDQLVELPVPHVTAYVQRFESLPKKRIFPFFQYAATAGTEVFGDRGRVVKPEGVPSGPTKESSTYFTSASCAYEDCRAFYHSYVYAAAFKCPVCRRGLSIKPEAFHGIEGPKPKAEG